MCEFIKPNKLTFEQELGSVSKPKIQPYLSKEVKRPENLQLDLMKYEFSKPDVSPVKIKTEYQSENEVKTDCVSDEEVAAVLGLDYNPPCSQQTYENDIRYAKKRLLERRTKEPNQGMIRQISISIELQVKYFLFKNNLFEQAHVLEMNSLTSLGSSATRKLLESWVPTWFLYPAKQTTTKRDLCAP